MLLLFLNYYVYSVTLAWIDLGCKFQILMFFLDQFIVHSLIVNIPNLDTRLDVFPIPRERCLGETVCYEINMLNY